jgi:hypothetical protein
MSIISTGPKVGKPVKIDITDIGDSTTKFAKTHLQDQALNVWMIEHGLGYDPGGVLVIDEENNMHWPRISYPTANTVVRLDFEQPVRGICKLS